MGGPTDNRSCQRYQFNDTSTPKGSYRALQIWGTGRAETSHNLLGRSALPLVTRLAQADATPPEWARLTRDTALLDYSQDDIRREFLGMTGQPLDETLEASQKDSTLENSRMAIHCAFLCQQLQGLPAQRDQAEHREESQPPREETHNCKRPAEDTTGQVEPRDVNNGVIGCSQGVSRNGVIRAIGFSSSLTMYPQKGYVTGHQARRVKVANDLFKNMSERITVAIFRVSMVFHTEITIA